MRGASAHRVHFVLLLLAGAAVAPTATARAEGALAADPMAFSAQASPDKVKLGEPFTLRIEVRDQAEVTYALPEPLFLGKEFEVLRVTARRDPGKGAAGTKAEASTPADQGETLTLFEIEAALYDLGDRQLADLTLTARSPAGEAQLTIPGPSVRGLGQAEPGAQMADALPPVALSIPDRRALYIGLATLAAAALLSVALYLFKRRRRPATPSPATPTLPPDDVALAALAALRASGLADEGRFHEFYSRLSLILRTWLSRGHAVDAVDMTTDELARALSGSGSASVPASLDRAELLRLCREADLIKFARASSSPALCEQHLSLGEGLVRAAAATPAPTEGADGGGTAPTAEGAP